MMFFFSFFSWMGMWVSDGVREEGGGSGTG